MGMTITEIFLAAHAGKDKVNPGETIWIDVDVLMTHDVCGPGTISIFKEQFDKNAKVFDREIVYYIYKFLMRNIKS
jgi:3-isopropylmalate/(R)-2-methylmalate dehydratase large subunit|tara:strand:- start:198 stop:425 length:228 start_codon:yes stop_codon:yes gene_type:complete